MALSMTPRKTCMLGDICVVCGFSFILIEQTTDGKENVHKFYDTKLRLDSDRIECIRKVTETSFDLENCSMLNNAGVCRKCFRSIETIIKTEEKNKVAKQKIKESLDQVCKYQILSLPSPRRKSITKRMLRSPDQPEAHGRQTKSLARVAYISPVKLTPFCEIGNRKIQQPLQIMQDTVNITCSEENLVQSACIVENPKVPSKRSLDFSVVRSPLDGSIEISPDTRVRRSLDEDFLKKPPVSDQAKTSTGILAEPMYKNILPLPNVSDNSENQKPAQKSFTFTDMRYHPSGDIVTQNEKTIIQGQGEVEVSINYPSGKKSVLVVCPSHKVICKAIVDNKNVDKTIVNTVCQQNPNIVVNAVTKIIENECSKICHRGSDSFLQKKDYEDFINFHWEKISKDLQSRCPHTLSIISSMVQNPPPVIHSKPFFHVMLSSAICLHGRNQEISALHYMTAFILARGGCIQRTIESLCKAGLTVHPQTLHNKLKSWQDKLDEELNILKMKWTNKEEGLKKFQLVGDNWDKDILPSYRTSDRKTESLHLFQIYAIVDRYSTTNPVGSSGYEDNFTFIPSLLEQKQLLKELTFVFASSIIRHVPQISKHFKTIFPKHLEHKHSPFAGIKTTQYSLGLFDTNENKSDEMIRLLRNLTDLYVPLENEDVVDAVFFGGDRLTDERVQCAQVAVKDSFTSKGRLEGFISKSEDFHRLMNFLEAICKLTYSSGMAGDPCTAHYYRNLLGHRTAKGPVKNAYRAYKMLYYTILGAICVVLFMEKLGSVDMNDLSLPDFSQMTPKDSIDWLNNMCQELVEKWFFENGEDICEEIRRVMANPQHEENYWTSTLEDGRFKCHHCEKDYKRVSSLKAHESGLHGVSVSNPKKKRECSGDELHDYVLMLFKLTMLHRNFDSAVDMGDGGRCVRSAKYELPIYHKTNKIKYSICSIHTTALSSGLLNPDQEERFIANRFVNIQGGKNHNIALDEYIEMLNRDSKDSCTGHKTKESILKHSKEYPLLVQFTKQFEEAGEFGQRKGFHHLPSYATDVEKVVKDLLENNFLQKDENRKLKVKITGLDRNPFSNCYQGLSTMVHRHRPWSPYGRLRDCKF